MRLRKHLFPQMLPRAPGWRTERRGGHPRALMCARAPTGTRLRVRTHRSGRKLGHGCGPGGDGQHPTRTAADCVERPRRGVVSICRELGFALVSSALTKLRRGCAGQESKKYLPSAR